ncbi:DUF2180 family protein [Kitasatospora sp. NPDC001159]
MYCLDCHSAGRQMAAVGVCSQCGAAVCPEHAEVGQQYLACTKPVYRTVTSVPPVRRLLCPVCAAAHKAHAACCPPDEGLIHTS